MSKNPFGNFGDESPVLFRHERLLEFGIFAIFNGYCVKIFFPECFKLIFNSGFFIFISDFKEFARRKECLMNSFSVVENSGFPFCVVYYPRFIRKTVLKMFGKYGQNKTLAEIRSVKNVPELSKTENSF